MKCKGMCLEVFKKLYVMFRNYAKTFFFFFFSVLIINNRGALQTQKIQSFGGLGDGLQM